jgi:hypothetical protein
MMSGPLASRRHAGTALHTTGSLAILDGRIPTATDPSMAVMFGLA